MKRRSAALFSGAARPCKAYELCKWVSWWVCLGLCFGCASDVLPQSSQDAGVGEREDQGEFDAPGGPANNTQGADAGADFDADNDTSCTLEICDGIDNDCDGEVDENLALTCATTCGDGQMTCEDGSWSACVGPMPSEEVCDSIDNNCDGEVDEGLSRACTTLCGEGIQTCANGVWGQCDGAAPELEVCDGVDNDCDGQIDEDLTMECTTQCGRGVKTCANGAWGQCEGPEPGPEVCDGLDNDCDGQVDEELTRACDTACGSGLERCDDGRWVNCDAPAPRPETCDNNDDDCDGQVDEGLSRPCSTRCGAGTESCRRGRWVNCDAPVPQVEVCDNVDNDCDGRVDEDLPHEVRSVSTAQLSALHSDCQGGEFPYAYCLSASHRLCSRDDSSCHVSGVGLLSVSGNNAEVLCLADHATVRRATYPQMNAAWGGDLTAEILATPIGLLVADRMCKSLGFLAGLGPLELGTSDAFFACFNGGRTQYRAIANDVWAANECNIFDINSGLECTSFAHQTCVDDGFRAGFGPVYLDDGDRLAAICFE